MASECESEEGIETRQLSCEVDVNEDLVWTVTEAQTCPVFMVSQARRKAIEVNMEKLTRAELKEFDTAKDKELSDYVRKEVMKVVESPCPSSGLFLFDSDVGIPP